MITIHRLTVVTPPSVLDFQLDLTFHLLTIHTTVTIVRITVTIGPITIPIVRTMDTILITEGRITVETVITEDTRAITGLTRTVPTGVFRAFKNLMPHVIAVRAS